MSAFSPACLVELCLPQGARGSLLGRWALVVLLIVAASPRATALGRISQRVTLCTAGQTETAPAQEESDPAGSSSEISELWGESRTTNRAVRRMVGRLCAPAAPAPGLAGRHPLRSLGIRVCAYAAHSGFGGPLVC